MSSAEGDYNFSNFVACSGVRFFFPRSVHAQHSQSHVE